MPGGQGPNLRNRLLGKSPASTDSLLTRPDHATRPLIPPAPPGSAVGRSDGTPRPTPSRSVPASSTGDRRVATGPASSRRPEGPRHIFLASRDRNGDLRGSSSGPGPLSAPVDTVTQEPRDETPLPRPSLCSASPAPWRRRPRPTPTRGGPARPNILWLIAEDFGAAPRLLRHAAGLDAQPRPAGGRGGALHAGLHHGAGLLAEPVGVHDRHVPDDDRRAQPPLAPRRRLPAARRASGCSPTGSATPGYFTANVRTFPDGLGFRGTGKTDWNFTHDGKPFDSDRWADLKAHQPFFAQVNFQETHRKFHAPKRADPAKVVDPAVLPRPPRHPRRTGPQYLDAASELDRKVGRILEQLEADGLADSTIVVFFGDNGQAHVRGKQFCYEEGLHVPLIIRWPKAFPNKTTNQVHQTQHRRRIATRPSASPASAAAHREAPAILRGEPPPPAGSHSRGRRLPDRREPSDELGIELVEAIQRPERMQAT